MKASGLVDNRQHTHAKGAHSGEKKRSTTRSDQRSFGARDSIAAHGTRIASKVQAQRIREARSQNRLAGRTSGKGAHEVDMSS